VKEVKKPREKEAQARIESAGKRRGCKEPIECGAESMKKRPRDFESAWYLRIAEGRKKEWV